MGMRERVLMGILGLASYNIKLEARKQRIKLTLMCNV